MNVDRRKLAQVFAAAQASFRHCSDTTAYHASEYWVAPAEIRAQIDSQGFILGDCDDFASLCVTLARKLQMPARFVLCLTETDESHLVCEVDGWILDNRQDTVRARDDLRYVWLAISGYNKGEPWHSIVEGKA